MSERTPQSPPVIIPVVAGTNRPLWSVMIPTYNCSTFLRETIESVLENDCGSDSMQIEVIDDHSTDEDVEKLIHEIGKGRVTYFQQKTNVGSLRNFETCLNRATGEWVHILHGDDKIEKGFYKEIKKLFTDYPETGAAFTKVRYINEKGDEIEGDETTPKNNGLVVDWLPQIAASNIIQPPAIVVKRKVYEKLGSFFAVHYGEDWEMWVRIAANYPVAFSPKRLAIYRYLRSNSISNASLRSGQNCKDIMKVINIIQRYLPEQNKEELKDKAKRNFSNYFANCSNFIYKEFQDSKAAFKQAKLAIIMDVNRTTIYSIFKMSIFVIISFLGLSGVYEKTKKFFLKNTS